VSAIKVQTPPAQEPISLAVLKNALRVTFNDDDGLLAIYLQGARESVESESGRSLVNKLYRQSHDRFPGLHDWGWFGTGYFYQTRRYAHHHRGDERQMIKLLRCPLVNVEKIAYIGTDQVTHTLLPAPALWLAENVYDVGDQFEDLNGNLQQVTASTEAETGGSGMSGAIPPSWGNTVGAITPSDGDLTEKCIAVPAPAGDFLVDADSEPPRIFPTYGTFWPMTLRVPNAVQIFFTAGYGNDAADAPANLKVALMMAAGVMYQHREAFTLEQLRALDWFERLIWSERVQDYAPTR
jgi:Phage gp6-like head-tail connector protein